MNHLSRIFGGADSTSDVAPRGVDASDEVPCDYCDKQNHSLVSFNLLARSRCRNCQLLHRAATRFCESYPIDIESIQQIYFPVTDGPSRNRASVSLLGKQGSVVIEFCQPRENSSADWSCPSWMKLGISPAISGATGGDEALRWAQKQLAYCMKHHVSCSNKDDRFFPSRILAIEAGREYVKVLEQADRQDPYVCLSYCWGNDQAYRLMRSNREQYCDTGISMSRLPRTVRHAIDFCIRLGYRFLWVDAYCIVQDDDLDKAEIISQMDSIFEQSALTLAATQASTVDQGCYALPAPPFYGYATDSDNLLVRQQITHYSRALSTDVYGSRLAENVDWRNLEFPLLNRAWALQELILAPRVLHFGPYEMLWQCRSAEDCECGRVGNILGKKSVLYPSDVFSASTWHSWVSVIERYSACHLTFESDRSIAIRGIARRYEREFEDVFVAGCWAKHLHYSLCWAAQHPAQKTSILPSWSWLSMTGFRLVQHPTWSHHADTGTEYPVHLMDAELLNKTADSEDFRICVSKYMSRKWQHADLADSRFDTLEHKESVSNTGNAIVVPVLSVPYTVADRYFHLLILQTVEMQNQCYKPIGLISYRAPIVGITFVSSAQAIYII